MSNSRSMLNKLVHMTSHHILCSTSTYLIPFVSSCTPTTTVLKKGGLRYKQQWDGEGGGGGGRLSAVEIELSERRGRGRIEGEERERIEENADLALLWACNPCLPSIVSEHDSI